MLVDSCSRTLPLRDKEPSDFDQIRVSIIKLADGDLDRMRDLISEAHKDWRDVILGAGFGDDGETYLQWNPTKKSDQ